MAEKLKTASPRPWHQMTLQEKRARLKGELLEEMVAMANQLRLQLSVDQIIRAIDQADYSPEEIEEQHRVHGRWTRGQLHVSLAN